MTASWPGRGRRPRTAERFDLVYAATAWHWLGPAVRLERAWEALRPGGHLAIAQTRPCAATGAPSCASRDAVTGHDKAPRFA